MARMATLEQAAQQIPGLSFHELYSGVRSGKYPGYRVGGARGKWIVNLDLLEIRIKELMEQNIKQEPAQTAEFGKLRRVQG
jgi:hypothetical protein